MNRLVVFEGLEDMLPGESSDRFLLTAVLDELYARKEINQRQMGLWLEMERSYGSVPCYIENFQFEYAMGEIDLDSYSKEPFDTTGYLLFFVHKRLNEDLSVLKSWVI